MRTTPHIMHFPRSNYVDNAMWNKCVDDRINQIIADSGYKPPIIIEGEFVRHADNDDRLTDEEYHGIDPLAIRIGDAMISIGKWMIGLALAIGISYLMH